MVNICVPTVNNGQNSPNDKKPLDKKNSTRRKLDECFIFLEIVLFGREVIILSNLLVLQPHMQPIVKNQKRHFVSAFCDTGAFCYAKQSSVALRNPIILSNLLVPRLRKPRIYRTKKAPLQVLLGFWFYFAAQRQCSFASAERLLCKSFLYCNCTCNRSTNHRVVAHADEAHHFDVCGNG